jgi:hypothetical protein
MLIAVGDCVRCTVCSVLQFILFSLWQCGSVRQCADVCSCPAVRQCAAVCATVCVVRQCAQQLVAFKEVRQCAEVQQCVAPRREYAAAVRQ